MSNRRDADTQQIYFRDIPGGGHVSILATPFRDLLGRRRYRGEVVLERRSADRRSGHRPPAVARAEGISHAALLHRLFPIAHSTPLLAGACLALATEGPLAMRRDPREGDDHVTKSRSYRSHTAGPARSGLDDTRVRRAADGMGMDRATRVGDRPGRLLPAVSAVRVVDLPRQSEKSLSREKPAQLPPAC